MKSVLLIGLGRFGRQMAEKLRELRHQILAVDRDEGRVNDILPLVTNAQIGDGTNEAFIASLGVRNFDLCVVAIGDNFQSSLETTQAAHPSKIHQKNQNQPRRLRSLRGGAQGQAHSPNGGGRLKQRLQPADDHPAHAGRGLSRLHRRGI